MKYNKTQLAIYKAALEQDYLLFVRFFSKLRWGIKFQVQPHHKVVVQTLMDVVAGRKKDVILNLPPGSSKTELSVINFIPYCLALNHHARFLHLSYADSLAELNSSTAKEVLETEEYQSMWPLAIAPDSSSKKRWNVTVDGKKAGGCYATSVGGQVTGFRAGRMAEGFQGCILLDDPLKPEDAWSQVKRERANRFITNTIKSRRATHKTPIILIMQRLHEDDPTGFLLNGPNGSDFDLIELKALIEDDHGNQISYWPDKEPVSELHKMRDEDSYTFHSQYMQEPVPAGGGMFKEHWFERYKPQDLGNIREVRIYCDTAQKKGQHNDFSVLEAWGFDGARVYLLDVWRGKWESPELIKKAKEFWERWTRESLPVPKAQSMKIEDKSSGTGLIQTFKTETKIPAIAIQRNVDKVSRAAACAPYCESGKVLIPQSSPWLAPFLGEIKSFSATMSHAHDDQVDPMMDAIDDFLMHAFISNTVSAPQQSISNGSPADVGSEQIFEGSALGGI